VHDQEKKKELLSSLEGLHCEKDPEASVGSLTLDRPPLNVVSFKAREQISSLLEEMDRDDDIRVIVIRGANGVFSSGGDISEFLQVEPDGMTNLAWHIAAPERCRKPVIAVLEKFAMGMALELALACDFRIATETTVLALPEINLGSIPGSGGTQRVARMAGLGRAKEMIMRGRQVSAQEALHWGLLTEVVPEDDLDNAVARWVEDMKVRPSIPLATLKTVLNQTCNTSLATGLELEGQAFEKLRFSPEFKHGIESFLAKRKPDFSEM
jgi:2-oxoglutaroyl-CoA hydrolase